MPDLREEIQEESGNVLEELQRVFALGESGDAQDVLAKTLKRFRQRLANVKSANQAVSIVLAMNVAANKHIRRGGNIKVQPTSLMRRRSGVSRGSKRIPAGRPATLAPEGKVAKRRPHKLSQAVNKNIASVKSHGRR